MPGTQRGANACRARGHSRSTIPKKKKKKIKPQRCSFQLSETPGKKEINAHLMEKAKKFCINGEQKLPWEDCAGGSAYLLPRLCCAGGHAAAPFLPLCSVPSEDIPRLFCFLYYL